MTNSLNIDGYALFSAGIDGTMIERLRSTIFHIGEAGRRCLLDDSLVRSVAMQLKAELVGRALLPPMAVAIQAIAFDKTEGANWKVAWHQGVMFPFARRADAPNFDLPSVKEGIDYARPPADTLEQLLAVRLHLDDCDQTNGPLRVAPGSHRLGILKQANVADVITRHGEVTCTALAGEALLMRPLLLHASSRALEPRHRRVLHVVYHSGTDMPVPWYRSIAR